jgi:hypothetical protein
MIFLSEPFPSANPAWHADIYIIAAWSAGDVVIVPVHLGAAPTGATIRPARMRAGG